MPMDPPERRKRSRFDRCARRIAPAPILPKPEDGDSADMLRAQAEVTEVPGAATCQGGRRDPRELEESN